MKKRYKFYSAADKKEEAIGTVEAASSMEAAKLFAKRKLLSLADFLGIFSLRSEK